MERRGSNLQPIAISLTVAAALLRLIPHPPNFAPIGSIALFGGARLNGWQAYLVPILAMLVTDPIVSYAMGSPAYSSMTPVIYGCFLINVALGKMFIGSSQKISRIASTALVGSVQFYLITNLFVWFHSVSLYPRTSSGLVECYLAALPFFANTVLADLLYSGLLFGAYFFFRNREPNPISATS